MAYGDCGTGAVARADTMLAAKRDAAVARVALFTPDETTLGILRALARGASRHDVAEAQQIAESTVRRRLAQLRTDWNVKSNIEVVVTAVRVGLI